MGDCGVWFLQQEAKRRFGKPARDVRGRSRVVAGNHRRADAELAQILDRRLRGRLGFVAEGQPAERLRSSGSAPREPGNGSSLRRLCLGLREQGRQVGLPVVHQPAAAEGEFDRKAIFAVEFRADAASRQVAVVACRGRRGIRR